MLFSGDDVLDSKFNISLPLMRLNACKDYIFALPEGIRLESKTRKRKQYVNSIKLRRILNKESSKLLISEHLEKEVSRVFLQGLIISRELLIWLYSTINTSLIDDYSVAYALLKFADSQNKKFVYYQSNNWYYRSHSENLHKNSLRQFSLIILTATENIPLPKLKKFKWDGIAFHEITSLTSAISLSSSLLEQHSSYRLVRKTLFSTIGFAIKRTKNIKLLQQISQEPRINAFFKILSHCGMSYLKMTKLLNKWGSNHEN